MATGSRRPRLDAVDIMRGLIIVVMAIDHVRDYWSNADFDPTDPAATTIGYFVTRWVTHLCAPWFMLLAGAGAYLSLGPDRDKRALVRFLLTRGLWLIVLELTVMNLAWKGHDFDPTFMRVLVLSALGGSMIALAGLVHLPRPAILAVAVVMIAGHDALDHIAPEQLGPMAWLWHLLHVPGLLGAQPHHGLSVFVLYPLVPWIGVMALGYCGGAWLDSLRDEPVRRARLFASTGVALLVAFAVLRAIDAYGDPSAWTSYPTTAQTVFAFLALSKYPPSLDYLLATIGLGLLVFAIIDRTSAARPWRVLRTFGRVPMWFYLLHIPLICISSQLVHRAVQGTWNRGDAWGVGLPLLYLLWITYVAVLYLPCRWYAGVKARRHDWWLGYL